MSIHEYPQLLFGRTVLYPYVSQLIMLAGLAMIQMQVFAFGFIEPHETCMGPLLEPILSLKCASCSSQLGVICKLAEYTQFHR